MNVEAYRDYCIAKPGATEEFPFDQSVLAFKVGGKIFSLADIDQFDSFNVKCDPEYAVELRSTYSAVLPGYHMSKKHWNTIVLDGSVADRVLFGWIDHSYDLVLKGLPKRLRDSL